jgi:hypothetical protein
MMQFDPGPSALAFNLQGEQEPLVLAPQEPVPRPRGRPRLDGAKDNTYLSQVRTLVRKAYRERNHDQLTVKVVREFSPGCLPIESEVTGPGYAEKKLSARLAAFQAALAQEPKFMRVSRHQSQHQFEKTLRDLCPPPTFAAASSTVVDRPR